MAILLLLASEAYSRVSRETRITKIKENTEQAYFTAEAGFNRVRAALSGCGNPVDLNGQNNVSFTYVDEGGVTRQGGTYSIQVTSLSTGVYNVVVTGKFGSEPIATIRVLQGVMTSTEYKSGKTCSYRTVTTQYNP